MITLFALEYTIDNFRHGKAQTLPCFCLPAEAASSHLDPFTPVRPEVVYPVRAATRYAVEENWRSFTLPGGRADQALQQVQARLDTYQIVDSNWPVKVLTPASSYYECYQNSMVN